MDTKMFHVKHFNKKTNKILKKKNIFKCKVPICVKFVEKAYQK